jgi:ankyrin repeat protein
MHFSAKFGSLECLVSLISRGAGVDPPDTLQRTPLMVALEHGQPAIAKSLVELGADIE